MKRSPRRPADATGRTPILVLGAGRRARALRDALRKLGLACRFETEPTAVLERLGEAIPLVIVVPPLPDLSAEDLCRRLRERDGAVPILVVGSPPRHAARLYRAGASGQFDWPAERRALIRTVVRLAGPRGAGRRQAAGDTALAARVEERLRAERETYGPLVRARVQEGVVFLMGEVDAAWKVSALARALTAMPGVEEVATTHLRVPTSGVSDRAVAAAVRSTLKAASGLEERTFGIRVSRGHVILTGTARSRGELDRVVGLIEQVFGVRSVENFAVVSPPAKRRDGDSARRLTRLVQGQFPNERVDVSVFGSIVVLSGRTRDAATRRAIEALVTNQAGVDRLVSKVR